MEFRQVLEGRRSVRDFRSDPIPREVLERVVGAAGLAPSSMNLQPWTFHVCTGDSRVQVGETVAQATVHLLEYMEVLGPERYEDAVKWYSSLGDAPVVIVCTMTTPDSEFEALNLTLSVGAALENLMLTAKAEGLGSCSITFGWWVRDELKALLGVPSEQTVASITALGYPSDVPPAAPPRREDIAVWHD